MNFECKHLKNVCNYISNMEVNVSDGESKKRLIAGAIILFLSLFNASILLLLIGTIVVATGYLKICPAYAIINSRRKS